MVFGVQLWLLTWLVNSCVTLCSPVLLCVTLWCYPMLLCVNLWCYTVVLPWVTLWCYPVLPCVPLCYLVFPYVPLCSPVNLVAMVLVVCQLSRDVIGYEDLKKKTCEDLWCYTVVLPRVTLCSLVLPCVPLCSSVFPCQFSRDGIGRLSVKPWCYWLWRL